MQSIVFESLLISLSSAFFTAIFVVGSSSIIERYKTQRRAFQLLVNELSYNKSHFQNKDRVDAPLRTGAYEELVKSGAVNIMPQSDYNAISKYKSNINLLNTAVEPQGAELKKGKDFHDQNTQLIENLMVNFHESYIDNIFENFRSYIAFRIRSHLGKASFEERNYDLVMAE